MPRLDRHVFVCTNVRETGECCAAKGSEEIAARLKDEIARRGLASQIRVNRAGCLGQCKRGPSIVVYPEQVWYGKVTLADVPELAAAIAAGVVVERLVMRDEP